MKQPWGWGSFRREKKWGDKCQRIEKCIYVEQTSLEIYCTC
jgi:hypothetical protein